MKSMTLQFKIEGFALLFYDIVAFHMLYVYCLCSELLVENLYTQKFKCDSYIRAKER